MMLGDFKQSSGYSDVNQYNIITLLESDSSKLILILNTFVNDSDEVEI